MFVKTFNNLISKRYGCPFHKGGSSKGHLELHEQLSKIDSTLAPPEQTIRFENCYYFVDCLFPNRKLIVEFYGTWWHGDPRYYGPDEMIGTNRKMRVSEKWQLDAERQATLEAAGYRVMIVWQNDWEEDPQSVLQSIKAELERLG